MRIEVFAVACLVLGSQTTAWAKDSPPGCEYAETPLAGPADAPKRSRLVLLATAPAAGEEVNSRTTVGIDVEYHIADFQPGGYELVVHFAEIAFGSTKIVNDGKPDGRLLTQPQGRAHLCAPLGGLFREDDVRWPLQMHVSLHKRTGARSSVLYAETQRVPFPSTQISNRALQRQKESFSDEYYFSLDAILAFHDQQVATYKACVDRLPDTVAILDAPFRAWTQGHGAMFAQMEALQMQVYDEITRGTTQTAAARMAEARREFTHFLDRLSDVSLRRRCMELPIALNGEPREFVGRHIAIVNEQLAGRPARNAPAK